MDDHEFCRRLKIEATELKLWIREGWLAPQINEYQRRFHDVDLARARLIRDLTHDMGVNEDGVGVIMDLVDQLYGLRMVMRELLSAVSHEDAVVKDRLRAALNKRFGARSE